VNIDAHFYRKQPWAEIGKVFALPPVCGEHYPWCLEQYLEIEAKRPVIDVPKIQVHSFFKLNIISTRSDLPQACVLPIKESF
jgi:hypothetical protein